MLAKRWRSTSSQTLPQCVACALRPELLVDVASRVDEYVSHETARVMVADDDEVPVVTRIRPKRVRECLGVALGITEDGDLLMSMDSVYDGSRVGLWSAVSVHAPGVFPDDTYQIVHSFVSLLLPSQ